MLRGGVETMMLGVDDDDARSRPTTAGTNA